MEELHHLQHMEEEHSHIFVFFEYMEIHIELSEFLKDIKIISICEKFLVTEGGKFVTEIIL